MVISFLPFEDFRESAKCLDSMRLGKMRSENYIILQRILFPSDEGGWKNHPMTLAWMGYPNALKFYLNCIIEEWEGRGYSNSYELFSLPEEISFPPFVGLKEFHFSHQASLLRKHPYYYSTSFPDLPSEYMKVGYLWPSTLSTEEIVEMKERKTYLSPNLSLFAEINQSQFISAEKSEYLFYSLSDLIEIAEKNKIEVKGNKTKREIFSFLKDKKII